MNDEKPLAEMTLPEARRHRQKCKLDIVHIQVGMKGTRGRERIEFEEAVEEARSHARDVEARIARLERKERTQP